MKALRPLLTALVVIILVFIAASLFDILLVFFYSRFYSDVAFIVTFAVAGIFAGVLAYMNSIDKATEKKETARWSIIIFLIITGLLFFFLLAKLEGGEYEPAFKAFGATLSLSSLLFVKGDPG